MDTVIVIGAGVTGLTTALMLKRMGYPNVIVVAKYIPGDMCVEYTSPYAGNNRKYKSVVLFSKLISKMKVLIGDH
jgi:thioredoxin reductase